MLDKQAGCLRHEHQGSCCRQRSARELGWRRQVLTGLGPTLRFSHGTSALFDVANALLADRGSGTRLRASSEAGMLKECEWHARRIARERRILPLSDSVYFMLVAMVKSARARGFADLPQSSFPSRNQGHNSRHALVSTNARRQFQQTGSRRAETFDDQPQRR